jgi:hypothetical protein
LLRWQFLHVLRSAERVEAGQSSRMRWPVVGMPAVSHVFFNTPSGDARGPHAGDVWQHQNGTNYHVLGIVRLEATNEPAVLYADDANAIVWVRSVADWFVEKDGRPRFVLVRQA